MFWTDWGTEGKIERAGMDGSHRQVLNGKRHSLTDSWELYRNGNSESSMICQYVCQSVLFVQPIKEL